MLAQLSVEFPNFGIKFHDMPIGVDFGSFHIAFYGMFIGLGMILGTLISLNYVRKIGYDVEDFLDLALGIIAFCLVGARAYYVLFRWDYYSKNPKEIIMLKEGGLAIYGGIIAGAIVCFVFVKIKKIPFLLVADVAMEGLLLGQILGRWGNFTNRECFGTACTTKNPLAMRIYFDKYFSSSDVPDVVAKGMEKITGKSIDALGYIQVHPTYLYESLGNLILLIIVIIVASKKKYDGQMLFTYLIGYGVVRFLVEGIRTDQLQIGNTGIAVSQALSGILFVCGILLMIFNSKVSKTLIGKNRFGTEEIVVKEDSKEEVKETSEDK